MNSLSQLDARDSGAIISNSRRLHKSVANLTSFSFQSASELQTKMIGESSAS